MAETVTMPKLGFDMAEGTLVRWVIQKASRCRKAPCWPRSRPIRPLWRSNPHFEGVLAQQLVQAGDVVPVNTPIAVITAPGEKLSQPEKTAPAPAAPPRHRRPICASCPAPACKQAGEPTPPAGRLPGNVKASPLARRMAADARINLEQVPGSGPSGRIVQRDIKAYLTGAVRPAAQPKPAASAPVPPAAQPAAAPVKAAPLPLTPLLSPSVAVSSPPPPDQVIPLTRLRAAIGRRMVESKQQVPHFYVTHEYDVAALLNLRTKINALLPDEEKISVNDFIVKAVALALRQFPNLNAALRGDQVVRYGAVNIGVAVAVENGLLTVVCRDADRKSLRQISSELRTMTGRARDGKVRPDDIEGSTFSVSNLGMYEVEHFIAIINPPEAAILAIGSAAPGPGRQGWAGRPRLAHESHHLGRPPRQRWRRSRPLPASPIPLPGATHPAAAINPPSPCRTSFPACPLLPPTLL